MSVKLYHAWRWKKKFGLFSVTDKIEKAGLRVVEKGLRDIVRRTKIQDNWAARMELADIFSQHVRTSAVSCLHDIYDINYIFIVRETPDYYLCVPCSRADYRFVDTVKEVEEYGYWDNTDRPKNMSGREWTVRRKIWLKYWNPERPAVMFSVLDTMDPSLQISKILVPESFGEFFRKRIKLPANYWEDKD